MYTRTPREMLALLVHSIEVATRDAEEATAPTLMIFHARSLIVDEARRVLTAHPA